jgi:hypothetical protein
MSARAFGMSDDPYEAARDEVYPYRALTPEERYSRFLDLMAFLEEIWRSLDSRKRAHYDQAQERLDDLGRWWERVPSR